MRNRASKLSRAAPRRQRPSGLVAPGGRRQAGFSLLEAAFAVAVFATLTTLYASMRAELVRDEEDKAAGQHAQVIQYGVNSYINNNRTALNASAAPVVAGFANPMAPTVAELAASVVPPYLPQGFPASNNLGMAMLIRLSRLPVGCTPGVNCTDIAGIEYSTAPLADDVTGGPDIRRVAAMATVVGDDAAFSPLTAPATFLGQAGTWTGVVNPVNTAGILGLRAGFGSVGYQNLDYLLPRDGSRKITADFTGAGFNLGNFKNIQANQEVDVTDAASCIRSQMTTNGEFFSKGAGCLLTAALSNAGLQIFNGSGQNTVSINSSALAMSDNPGVGIPKVTIDTTGNIVGTDGNVTRAALRGATGRVETFGAGGAPAVTIDGSSGSGRLATNGLSVNDYPAGWAGGVRAYDMLASGTVATWDGATIKSSINSAGDSYVANNAQVGNVLQLNAVSTENTPCTLAGQQSRNASGALLSCVNNGTLLWLKSGLSVGVIGQPCAPNGALAQDTSDNTLLCRKGFYVQFNDYVPSVVDLDSIVVNHGQNVTKPSCGVGGTPSILIANGSSQTDPTGILNVYSLDLGGYWQVQITSGGGTQAGPGAQMTARIACIYA